MTALNVFVYFDYQCPHSYLTTAVADQVRLERNVSFHWRPVPLYTEPGLELIDLTPDPTAWRADMKDIERRAASSGLPFRVPLRTFDTYGARQAAEFARDLGPVAYERVHRALFRAFFGEGVDLGICDRLLAVCEDAGVDRQALAEALTDERYAGGLADITEEALHYGVDSLPSMLVGRYRIIGSAPADVVVSAIDRAVGDARSAPV